MPQLDRIFLAADDQIRRAFALLEMRGKKLKEMRAAKKAR